MEHHLHPHHLHRRHPHHLFQSKQKKGKYCLILEEDMFIQLHYHPHHLLTFRSYDVDTV